jgi:hypothetical protein
VAEAIGRLLLYLKKTIELGPEEQALAVNTLMEGIHMLYQYTTGFALSRKLGILSVEGDLTPASDPDSLMERALETGLKETTKGRRRRATRHGSTKK